MPSGKYLWLCSQHQSLPRVTVLPDVELEADEEDAASSSAAEANLLLTLKMLKYENMTTAYEGCYSLHLLEPITLLFNH